MRKSLNKSIRENDIAVSPFKGLTMYLEVESKSQCTIRILLPWKDDSKNVNRTNIFQWMLMDDCSIISRINGFNQLNI